MRTLKALLCLSALAGGIATSVAQSNVYSLNIVGYVNVPLTGNGALNMVSNPLKPSNGNYNITNTVTMPASYDGAFIYKWGGTAWANDIPTYIDGAGWIPDFDIALGEAMFIQSPAGSANTTITFVGEVATGTNVTTLPTGLTLVASKVPVAEPFPGYVGNDGDFIYLWNGTGGAWSDTIWTFIDGVGWLGDYDSTNGPIVPVASGVFYQNLGSSVNVTRILNP